jgi:hypothetical protein
VVDLAPGDRVEQRLDNRVVPALGRKFIERFAEPHRQLATRNTGKVAVSANGDQPFAQMVHQAEAEPAIVICQRSAVEAGLLVLGGDCEVGTITRRYLLKWRVAKRITKCFATVRFEEVSVARQRSSTSLVTSSSRISPRSRAIRLPVWR